jgi:hypothetical protein
MKREVPIRLVLVGAPTGVDFALQRGRGANYEPVQIQSGRGADLAFDFTLTADVSNRTPIFTGPFAQGTPADRFVYIGVGTFAGQTDVPWSRRIKVPLKGITAALVEEIAARPGARLEARVPGTGKDGTPGCATVKLVGDWLTTLPTR